MEQRTQSIENRILKVAITGPESTGKSMLASALAEYYDTCYNPEYAREYLQSINRQYTYDDVVHIGLKQMNSELQMLQKANKVLFCDTDLLVIKTWMDFKYQKHPRWVADWIISGGYDLFILCNIDIPWEPDPLREHPEARQELFNIYYNELNNNSLNFIIASGSHHERMKQSTQTISNLFGIFKQSIKCI